MRNDCTSPFLNDVVAAAPFKKQIMCFCWSSYYFYDELCCCYDGDDDLAVELLGVAEDALPIVNIDDRLDKTEVIMLLFFHCF